MDPIVFLSDIITRLGYLGVAASMFIEAAFPPIPSEVVLPFAGFSASEGNLSLIGVFIAAMAGSLLGAVGLYYIGRVISEERIYGFVGKYGRYLGIKRTDITKAHNWFVKHGNRAVFFGRMIPIVRTLISIPAGISGMPFTPFILWTTLGTAIWSGLLIMAGYILGSQYEKVAEYMAPVSKIVLFVILAITIQFFYFKITKRRKAKASQPSGDQGTKD